MNASKIIDKLNLQAHPEGGYYRETYRSEASITANENTSRNLKTAILFLLKDAEVSKLHRIKSDELWFFHTGEPIEIISLENEQIKRICLGLHFDKSEIPQCVIPANTWFAAHLPSKKGFGLVSCTVAPGFDFADFEMADQNQIKNDFGTLFPLLSPFL